MSRDKQIEEMAIDVLNSSILPIEDATDVAKSLYNRGYRKASDVAREIFEEIEKARAEYIHGKIDENQLIVRLYQLKKKYTENEG